MRTAVFNSAIGESWSEPDGLLHTTTTLGCGGGDFNLRINSSIKANTSNSYIAVTPADSDNKVVLHLKWGKCS